MDFLWAAQIQGCIMLQYKQNMVCQAELTQGREQWVTSDAPGRESTQPDRSCLVPKANISF